MLVHVLGEFPQPPLRPQRQRPTVSSSDRITSRRLSAGDRRSPFTAAAITRLTEDLLGLRQRPHVHRLVVGIATVLLLPWSWPTLVVVPVALAGGIGAEYFV